jgi:hypothetical protein
MQRSSSCRPPPVSAAPPGRWSNACELGALAWFCPPPPFLPLCPCHLDWNFPTQRGLFGLALCVLRRLRGVVFSRAGPCSFSPGATVTLPAAARRIILVKRRDVEERALENHNELEARLRFEFPPDSVHVYALRMQSSAHRTRGAPE